MPDSTELLSAQYETLCGPQSGGRDEIVAHSFPGLCYTSSRVSPETLGSATTPNGTRKMANFRSFMAQLGIMSRTSVHGPSPLLGPLWKRNGAEASFLICLMGVLHWINYNHHGTWVVAGAWWMPCGHSPQLLNPDHAVCSDSEITDRSDFSFRLRFRGTWNPHKEDRNGCERKVRVANNTIRQWRVVNIPVDISLILCNIFLYSLRGNFDLVMVVEIGGPTDWLGVLHTSRPEKVWQPGKAGHFSSSWPVARHMRGVCFF